MIRLSYSSLNNLVNGHEWLNKQLGIPVPDYPFLNEGKEAHRIIQEHLSGKENPLLESIKLRFPIVEKKDFDEDCKFSFSLDDVWDDDDYPEMKKYEIFGFVDGYDPVNKRILEIKTSSTAWTIQKFKDLMQRKLYTLAFPEYKECVLITGSKDPEEWKATPPKVYSLKIVGNDMTDALAWIKKGIDVLESGDFSGGLDENGKCKGCFWNMDRFPELANCHFM